ncbi:hypothetical protein ACOMHN_056515 [Nucella lapillus]
MMDRGGTRMNGVKEKEERLRRMQIQLGRARLVNRSLEQVLQQPVSIVPSSDPDSGSDFDHPCSNTEPGFKDEDGHASSVDQKHTENDGTDIDEASDFFRAELRDVLDSTDGKHLSTNPFHESFACGHSQDKPHRNSNPFTDFHKPEPLSSDPLTNVQRSEASSANPFADSDSSEFPSSNPFTDTHKSDFSDLSVTDASENTTDDDLKDAFLNSFSLVPTQASLEDPVDGCESFSELHVSNILSPISEENSLLSISSDKDIGRDSARKDSGYCVTSFESLPSMTSPDSERSHVIWKLGSTSDSNPSLDITSGSRMVVTTKHDGFMPSPEDSSCCAQSNSSKSTLNVSEEELISLAGIEPSERDSSERLGSFGDREMASGEHTAGLGKDDPHQPGSVCDNSPASAGLKSREMNLIACSADSFHDADTQDVSSEDTTGEDNMCMAFSDMDSDLVSSPNGLDVDGESSDAAISETDAADFQSSAVGLLVEVYGMDKDEICAGNLSEIPEETATELDASSMSDTSDPPLSDESADLCSENMSARKSLKKEPHVDMGSLDEQDSTLEGDRLEITQLCDRGKSVEKESAASRPLCNSPPASGVAQVSPAQNMTKGESVDSQQDTTPAQSSGQVQSLLFIDNLQFSIPQGNSRVDFDQGETDVSLLGDVSDYSLTTCYDSLDPSMDLGDGSVPEIRPEIFEAFASEIISNLMDGSFSISSMPSMNFEGCNTPTQSLSSFEKNELDCSSPALSQDLEDTLSLPSDEGEETHPKEAAAEGKESEQTVTCDFPPTPCLRDTSLAQHADVKMGEIVSDRLPGNVKSCKRKEGFEQKMHVTLDPPTMMPVVEETGVAAQGKESRLDADTEESLEACAEKPVKDGGEVESGMCAEDYETDTGNDRERQIPNTVSCLPLAHHLANQDRQLNTVHSQRHPRKDGSVSLVDESSCDLKERRETAQMDPVTERFMFSDERRSANVDADCELWQNFPAFQEAALENYITPNIQIRSVQRETVISTTFVDLDEASESDSSDFGKDVDSVEAVGDREMELDCGRVQEAAGALPAVVIAAGHKERKDHSSTDFTTLSQSPILTRITHTSASAKPDTASNTHDTSLQESGSPYPCTEQPEVLGRHPNDSSTLAGHDQALDPDGHPSTGESNMSYLLNKWQRMEEASGSSLSPCSQEQENISGLSSSRYLSKSTPDFSSIHAVHTQDLHLAADPNSSTEETERAQNTCNSSTHISSREPDHVIYGSTGDLQTSGKSSRKPRMLQPASDSTLTIPQNNRYLMSSIESLNIVLITSGDNATDSTTEQQSREALSSVSSREQSESMPGQPGHSSAKSSAFQEAASPGLQEVKETVAGLPSVLSLIAKFSHLGHKSSTDSPPTSFASSRKRWSSAPRLHQTCESSSLPEASSPSSGKERRSSVHYRWDPSTSSWVPSSASPGRHRPVSSRSAKVLRHSGS